MIVSVFVTSPGVDINGQIVSGHLLKKRQKFRIIKWLPVDIAVDIDPFETKIHYRPVSFLQCGIKIVHGKQRNGCDKPVAVFFHQFSHFIIRHPGQFSRLLRSSKILQGWHRADRQHLNYIGI